MAYLIVALFVAAVVGVAAVQRRSFERRTNAAAQVAGDRGPRRGAGARGGALALCTECFGRTKTRSKRQPSAECGDGADDAALVPLREPRRAGVCCSRPEQTRRRARRDRGGAPRGKSLARSLLVARARLLLELRAPRQRSRRDGAGRSHAASRQARHGAAWTCARVRFAASRVTAVPGVAALEKRACRTRRAEAWDSVSRA